MMQQHPPGHGPAQGNVPRTVSSEKPAAGETENIEKEEEALLDEAIALTFPASDPIAVSSYEEAREKSKWRRNLVPPQTN